MDEQKSNYYISRFELKPFSYNFLALIILITGINSTQWISWWFSIPILILLIILHNQLINKEVNTWLCTAAEISIHRHKKATK